MIDTSRTIEIEGSGMKMLGLGVLCLGMVAVSVALLVFGDAAREQIGGWVGLVFFGLCAAMILQRWLTLRGPVVTVSPEGFRDKRISADVIPWSSISQVSTWSAFDQSVLVLKVDPAVEAKLALTRIAKMTLGPNKSLGADGLSVTAQGLKVSFDELRDLVVTYRDHYAPVAST